MKIKNIFRIIQGHQITDEEIYRNIGSGNISIYTSNNEIKGYWNKSLVSEQDLPCLTYPTKAFSGEIFIQHSVFDANNTAVMIPYPEWREQIILEWASFKLSNVFLDIATSKGGVSYLNKEIVEDYDLIVPSKDIQQNELKYFKILKSLKNRVKILLTKTYFIKERGLSVNYLKYQAQGVPINKILDCYSGNTGLTEKEIYQKLLIDGTRYKILSASTSEETRLGYVPKFQVNGKEIEVLENKEGILVIRKGKAGRTYYYGKGKYALTDDAYFLTIKTECQFNINLKWLIYQYRHIFFDYSSSSDNGTWNMTGFFNDTSIDIPFLDEQLEVVKRYDYIESLQKKIDKIKNNIDQLSNRQLVG
jgi:hypothetical protein